VRRVGEIIMPYTTVANTKKRVAALKGMTDKQVKVFIATFNSLIKDGVSEKRAYAIAIAAAKKSKRSTNKGVTIMNEDRIDVLKATKKDIEKYLRVALQEKYKKGYIYRLDFDDDYVYFTYELYEGNEYTEKTYKLGYTVDGVNLSLSDQAIEVKKESTYTEVSESKPITEKSLTSSIVNAFKQVFIKDHNFDNTIPVIKQLDEEQMIAIEPLYCPPDEPDGHKEAMSVETIRSMVVSFNKAIEDGRLASNIDHNENVDGFHAIEAWVNPCECYIGDTFIPEGQPIVKMQFTDKDMWEKRKSGELKGVSIGGRKAA